MPPEGLEQTIYNTEQDSRKTELLGQRRETCCRGPHDSLVTTAGTLCHSY